MLLAGWTGGFVAFVVLMLAWAVPLAFAALATGIIIMAAASFVGVSKSAAAAH